MEGKLLQHEQGLWAPRWALAGDRRWEMGLGGSLAVDVDRDGRDPLRDNPEAIGWWTPGLRGFQNRAGALETLPPAENKPSNRIPTPSANPISPLTCCPLRVPCVSPPAGHRPDPPAPRPRSNALPLLGLGCGGFLRTFIKISLLKGKWDLLSFYLPGQP